MGNYASYCHATMTAPQVADELLHSLSEVVDAADRISCCCDCTRRIEKPIQLGGRSYAVAVCEGDGGVWSPNDL